MQQTPDPGHAWIRYALRPWPGPRRLWLDLFSRGLGRSWAGSEDSLPDLEVSPNDVLYLPPVDVELQPARRELVDRLVDAGTPLVVQHLPGEEPLVEGPAATYDLLACLVDGNLELLRDLPPGVGAIWPLIGGCSDDVELWEAGLERLAAAGVACVQGLCPDLSPADRRRLVEEIGESGFGALFHGRPPSERRFAQLVARFGMRPFTDRPLPRQPPALVGNRRLAGVLAAVGELWLRLERSEARGQAFYRAARLVDRENHDLCAMCREGNLAVVTWLDAPSREVIEEVVSTGRASLLEKLRGEYLRTADDQAAS